MEDLMTTRQKVAWMVVCLVAGASVRMFINERPAVEPAYFGVMSFAQWSLVLSPIVFLFSAVRVFVHEKAAVVAGFIGAILALPNPLLLERYLRQVGLSWWTSFNMPPREFGGTPSFASWLIVSIAASVLVLLLSITRLLPTRHEWRGVSLSRRTWPAISVTLLALAAWYAVSVSPYRIPVIVDAASPELTILHVKKHGIAFSEISVRLYRDGRMDRSIYSRHMFQYAFPIEASVAIIPRDLFEQSQSAIAKMNAEQAGGAIKSLHGWNAEGWYVLAHGQYSYLSDAGSRPPEELVQLFDKFNKLPLVEQGTSKMRDICFGFCYDPWAGLGAVYINQRCRWSPDGKTRTCL